MTSFNRCDKCGNYIITSLGSFSPYVMAELKVKLCDCWKIERRKREQANIRNEIGRA